VPPSTHPTWPDPDPSAGVTTTGRGAAVAEPDVVVVDLGAEASATDVQAALDAAGTGLAAAREALLAGGVASADLRTTHTSTWTQPAPDAGAPDRVTARLTLRATVRDVAVAGSLVRTALGAAGPAARLDTMGFAVSDPGPLAARAREEAFADARAKAAQFAELAGRGLGAVVEVSEQGPGAVPMPRALSAGAADAMVVDPGREQVEATVTVRWAWATENAAGS
jgi:uncharacterized protein